MDPVSTLIVLRGGVKQPTIELRVGRRPAAGLTSDLLPWDSPSRQGLVEMQRRFGGKSGVSLAVVVFERAQGRLTAGFVLDLRKDPAVRKALMFFHASAFSEKTRGFWANCSLGLAWSDDLKNWSWPAQAKTAEARPDGLPGFRKLMDGRIAPLPDKLPKQSLPLR
jgi:hypothetical protein